MDDILSRSSQSDDYFSELLTTFLCEVYGADENDPLGTRKENCDSDAGSMQFSPPIPPHPSEERDPTSLIPSQELTE